jgi:hypothetical protein
MKALVRDRAPYLRITVALFNSSLSSLGFRRYFQVVVDLTDVHDMTPRAFSPASVLSLSPSTTPASVTVRLLTRM